MDIFEQRASIWQVYTSMAAIGVAVWISSAWSILAFLLILVAGATVEGVCLGLARIKP